MGSLFAFENQYFIEPHYRPSSQKQRTVKTSEYSSFNSQNSTFSELTSLYHTMEPHIVYRIHTSSHKRGETSSLHKKPVCNMGFSASNTHTTHQKSSKSSPKNGYLKWTNHRADPELTNQTRANRKRRSVSRERHVEVMVAADYHLYQYHKEDTRRYVLTLMSIVANIYRHHSIGNAINIIVTKIIVIRDPRNGPTISRNAAATLKHFCAWQHKHNAASDNDAAHYDTALLLTRQDICRSETKCDTLGLAELGTICDPKRSCSINEDNGLSAAFTITHELGHVFNLPHDDARSCLKFLNPQVASKESQYHVMAPTLDHKTRPWSWSRCSRHMMTQFLDSGKATCLLDRPVGLFGSQLSQLPPGNQYSVNRQCEFVFERGSKICPYMPQCEQLWCTGHGGLSQGCRTKHMPWSDGTVCGHRPGFVCLQGKCVKWKKTIPVEGGWSRWHPYTPCSRNCGGGIKRSERFCNNPVPKYGGRFCIGDRVKYRSCHVRDCADSSSDFREEQCARLNGRNFNILGISTSVKWVPKYQPVLAKDVCKLVCRVAGSSTYYTLAPKVIDGTKCTLDSTDVCIDGKCQKAGCDNRLGSDTKFDNCGVCGGTNSTCRTVRGQFTQVRYGYNTVVRIPAGAQNINITQTSGTGVKLDDNYLAMRNSEGEPILNGKYSVSKYARRLAVKDAFLDYNGCDNLVERINSSRKISEDIILMVLSVGKLLSPNIKFEYTISVKSLIMYYWRVHGHWSKCDQLCQGKQRRRVICVRDGKPNEMAPGFHCMRQKKPEELQACNTACTLRWDVTQSEFCPAPCNAKGHSPQKVRCIKKTEVKSSVVDNEYCPAPEPPSFIPCVGKCHPSSWSYSEWNECSRSCGGGLQDRTAVCRSVDGSTTSNGNCDPLQIVLRRRCNTDPCPMWMGGKWTQCSSSCGHGIQRRSVWCESKGRRISKTYCRLNDELMSVRPCYPQRCPEPLATTSIATTQPATTVHQESHVVWHAGAWGQCSHTCGKSVKSRLVVCRVGSSIVSDVMCNALRKPAETVPCATETCPKSTLPKQDLSKDTTWRTGRWTKCSASCGTGRQQRYVSCRDGKGVIAPDQLCTPDTKPSRTRVCETQACGYWRTGGWGQCSKSCGAGGIQTRLVRCVHPNPVNEVDLAATLCDPATKPSAERACVDNAACRSEAAPPAVTDSETAADTVEQWRVGPWGPCSVSCGGGRAQRRVVCRDGDACDTRHRPVSQRVCNQKACPVWNHGAWGRCSASCGRGLQKRVVRCQLSNGRLVASDSCDPLLQPIEQRACQVSSCLAPPRFGRIRPRYRGRVWHYGDWSQCSLTCGYGRQDRHVICVNQLNRTVSDIYCPGTKPQTARLCHQSHCYFWKKSHWQQCSEWCGHGIRKRKVYCTDSTNRILQDSDCAATAKPITERRCRGKRCARWKTTSWSKCSTACGRGIKRRTIHCVLPRFRVTNPSRCSHKPRPRSVTACHKRDCTRYEWRKGVWSECSQSCGQGMKTRLITCVDTYFNKSVETYFCDVNTRPGNTSVCSLAVCEFIWVTEPWTQCSSACGEGTVRRSVHCRHVSIVNLAPPADGRQNMSRRCSRDVIPAETQTCNRGSCKALYRWSTSQWSKCSASCGFGHVSRRVYCSDIDGRAHEDEDCLPDIKPVSKESCFINQCFASSCKNLKEIYSVEIDGDYLLMVNGTQIKLFCFRMDRADPTEYLSLPSGRSNNFVINANRGRCLKNECERCENCPKCDRKLNDHIWKIYFDKIRLDITTLQLFLTDHKFAMTRRQNAKRKTFNDFKFDLTTTDLYIRTNSTYMGSEITLSKENQLIKGRCKTDCRACPSSLRIGLR